MAYVALTPAYFDAALAGAVGGQLDGQSTTSVSTKVYAEVNLAAASIAQEIDTLIGVATPTVGAANLLTELVYAWTRGRNPGSNPNASTVESYHGTATAIIAAWTAAKALLQ